jgi:hypothetical protein
MENLLKTHWTEFERMVRHLGALRLERDVLLGAGGSTPCRHLVEAFGDAVSEVCRFGGIGGGQDAGSAEQAWVALERAREAARQARAALGAPDTPEAAATRDAPA